MEKPLKQLFRKIVVYIAILSLVFCLSTLVYQWYFVKWVDNGAQYFDNIKGINTTNHYKSRGRIDSRKLKQGYWIYWRPGKPIQTEVVEWIGKLKSRKTVYYPSQGKKLKEGYYRDGKMHGFWVFWSKTMQVDRKLTGLYENGKLVRNARDEFFPKPEADHPFVQMQALIWSLVWMSLVITLVAVLILWLLYRKPLRPETAPV